MFGTSYHMNMKKIFYYITVCFALIACGSIMVSCGSDDEEPEPVVEDEPVFVTSRLYNIWEVIVEEVDNGDGTVTEITYSGNQAPYFTYNKVSKGNTDAELTWQVYEIVNSNLTLTKTIHYTIKDKTFYDATGQKAGNLVDWNPKNQHANMVIKWEPFKSPMGWTQACKSTYMICDYVTL